MLLDKKENFYNQDDLSNLMSVCIKAIRKVLKKFQTKVIVEWGYFPSFGSDCFCIYIPVSSMLGAEGLEGIQEAVTNVYLADHDAKICLLPFFNDRHIENNDFNEDLYLVIGHFLYIIAHGKLFILKKIAEHLKTVKDRKLYIC